MSDWKFWLGIFNAATMWASGIFLGVSVMLHSVDGMVYYGITLILSGVTVWTLFKDAE